MFLENSSLETHKSTASPFVTYTARNIRNKDVAVVQAYQERSRTQAFKVIEKSKVELRIKEYVRDLIHRLHDRKHAKTRM